MDEKARQLQQALADQLKAGGLLNDPAIEAAFRAVPRHLFLPHLEPSHAYTDDAIGTKFLDDGRPISSSSQPTIMAIMLDQLGLKPGQRVLEIGAGTGYNAALIAHIVGETGLVISIDIDEDIVLAARRHLQEAGFERAQVIQTDGFSGFPDYAPYDRIVLAVGCDDISPAWWEQLAPGGRVVAPLQLAGQNSMVSVAFEWAGDHLESLSQRACGFMMLRGEGACEECFVPIDGRPDLSLEPSEQEVIDPRFVAEELQKPVRDIASEINLVPWQLERDIRFWLARAGMKCFVLNRQRQSSGGRASGVSALETSLCVMRDGLLCLLTLDRPSSDLNATGHLWMYRYGEADALAREALLGLRQWEEAGRPSAETMRIRAYPANARNVPDDAEIMIEKKSVRLLLNWPEEQ